MTWIPCRLVVSPDILLPLDEFFHTHPDYLHAPLHGWETKTAGHAVKKLDLSGCDLDDIDVHKVIELVHSCPFLEVLDLRCGQLFSKFVA